MFRPFRLGSLFGFPIEVRMSFLMLLAAVLFFMGGVSGLFLVLLAFGSVILHELGHAVVARHLGVGVSGIELHFFGGMAKMMGQPKRAGDEVAIAAAGPAVSFMLSGLGFLAFQLSGLAVFQLLAWVNVVIGAFNLIPALPMDGGRILRALLSLRLGFARATDIAVKVSRVTSVAFAIVGLAAGQIQLVLLSVVLWFLASGEARLAQAVRFRERAQRIHDAASDFSSQGASQGQRRGFSFRPRRDAHGRRQAPPGYVFRRLGNHWYMVRVE